MRLERLLFLALPIALAAVGTVHCSSGDEDPGEQPVTETSTEETLDEGVETTTDSVAPDTVMDTAPDTTTPTTCTKAPAFSTAVRVNHNPDSLRRVANAGMTLLDDGRIMIAMLEALDTGTRYAVWARIFDPKTSSLTPDERLDVDADSLTESSPLQIVNISNLAVGVRYGGAHFRVYSKGKWSPDVASVMAVSAADDMGWAASTTGQVLVTRGRTSAPGGQATVYRPDEGGVKGSWSAVQTLDLDGASGKPRIDSIALSDGRFLTLVWQGTGGPSIRVRSLSGSWSTPSPKAELGAVDASPQYRMLDDGSIVLAALEGSGDTRRVVTTTWTGSDNWSATRLLSKLPGDVNGVVPVSPGQFLFGVGGNEVEFVSWVAGCTSVAKDCEFSAISRRYTGGTWKDPVPLGIGEKRNGPDGMIVVALDAFTPLVARVNATRSDAELRVRNGADYTTTMSLTKDSPLFSSTTTIEPRFYGTPTSLWTLVRRETTSAGMTTALAGVAGKIDATAGKVEWGLMAAGAFEMRTFGELYPYVDGAGGFSVGVGAATDGSTSAPMLAHSNAGGVTIEAATVLATDEKSASFVNVPRTAPRPDRDKSAMFVLAAKPSDTTSRLRAYAYNGIGGRVPQVLANETRAPRSFADGMLLFGCGGAILYAADAMDGSHTLELVLVKEAAAGDAG
jgi:hypothetical protein